MTGWVFEASITSAMKLASVPSLMCSLLLDVEGAGADGLFADQGIGSLVYSRS
jgi:hypothetical protein